MIYREGCVGKTEQRRHMAPGCSSLLVFRTIWRQNAACTNLLHMYAACLAKLFLHSALSDLKFITDRIFRNKIIKAAFMTDECTHQSHSGSFTCSVSLNYKFRVLSKPVLDIFIICLSE